MQYSIQQLYQHYTIQIFKNTINNTQFKGNRIMQFLSQTQFIQSNLNKFFKPHRIPYNDDILNYFLTINKKLQHQQFIVKNCRKEDLVASLFKYQQTKLMTCIVYMHGYGSNRFEALNLLNIMDQNYSLCCFDFSGLGRSQGDYVSYGNKQKLDIDCILTHLRKLGFKNFILWGRSMGATSTILYTSISNQNDIIAQILDSPFESFKNIAVEQINKKISIPNLAINILWAIVENYCKKLQYNPCLVDACRDMQNCTIPTMFIYCKNDIVVSYENSLNLMKACSCRFQRLQIQQNHNTLRSHQTLEKIFQFIEKYEKLKYKKHQRKTYKQSLQQFRKGIKIITTSTSINNFDNYGIWVSMKYTQQKVIKQKKIKNYQKNLNMRQNCIKLKSPSTKSTKIPSRSNSLRSFGSQQVIIIGQQHIKKKGFKRLLSHDRYL